MSDQKTKAAAVLALEKNGRVTAEALVAAAKAKNHPLHNDFTWDDRKAAHQHRLDQARAIIASVRVTVTTETVKISSPAYVRDPSMKPGKQGHISVAFLRTDEDLANDALLSEVRSVVAAYERAKEFANAVGLTAELEIAIESAMKLLERARRGPSGLRIDQRVNA